MQALALKPLVQPALRFSLHLPAIVCYRQPVADMVCSRIASAQRISALLHASLRTAVHEAVLNALAHGTLGIHDCFRGRGGMRQYYALIETKLAEPRYRDTPPAYPCACRAGFHPHHRT